MSIPGESPNQPQRFEIGDEVIGDEHIRGVILGTNDICRPSLGGYPAMTREYLVRSDKGEKFLYAGESNLRLVRKGLGESSPPRAEFLKELEADLRNRPLAGLRI
ncbi:MAG: hypothetical protein JO217_09120 [Acidobacteriaceae bacterium]|nr:hypothetical protein [Acidobacteriaceae bacterium]